MAPAPLSPAEASFFPSLFSQFQSSGSITGASAFNLLPLSDVPLPVLGEIWGLADPEDKGSLDVAGWTVCMRLIGVAQRGGEVTKEAGEQASVQLPKFRGHSPPPPSILRTPQPQSQSSFSNNNQQALNPPLTPEDIAKFKRHFSLAGPVNGQLSSEKATNIFLKSKLPSSQLGLIWNLADTQDRGALDQADFIIGMYFIQGVMSQKITSLPPTLPQGLYEIASEGRSLPHSSSFNQDLRSLSHSPAPISRQTTGAGLPPPATPVSRQVTGQQQQPTSPIARNVTGGGFPSQSSHQMLPNVTGGSFSQQNTQNNAYSSPTTRQSGFSSAFAPPAAPAQAPWDVTPAEKTASDRFFNQLDKFGRGLLDGDVAVPFMLESKLPEADLASIWDLAGIRNEGNLDRDEFAVAMYLIKSRISGKELPPSLPASLVPPSLRQAAGQSTAPPAPERDLFDAFGDSPPASANAATNYFAAPAAPAAPAAAASPPSSSFADSSQGFGMTPFGVPSTTEEDLFGDETPFTPFAPAPAAPAPPIQARSPAPSNARSPPPPPPPELAKLRTESTTLSKSVSDLQSSGLTLENQTLETAKEIMDLQAKLVGLRATHESEKGNVDKLKAKSTEQAATLKQLSSDLIRAESELSGLRGEKTDVDGQMMRDKEDIREMKRRMVEIGEQTTQLHAQVEKAKRDARQQKGLLTITKKQVGTAEAEKDKATQALADAERGVGIEVEVVSPVSAFAPSVASAFAAQHHASQVPLPETPERMLSPALSVTSQKSNNPFDRFVPTPPVARSPAAPVKELAEESPSAAADVVPTSPVTYVKEIAVGGVVAAGAALAGVGAAVFGSSTDEDDKKAAEESKEVKAEEPTAAQSFAASAFDDSFGSSPPSTQTPFAPASSDTDPKAAWDAGFNNDWDDKPDAVASTFPAVETGTGVASPSEAPFSGNGFESSFGEEFTPVKPEEDDIVTEAAKEVAPVPVELETSDLESASTATVPIAAVAEDEQDVPSSSTAHPIGQVDDAGEVDSSDDEDEGPEDLDGGYKPSIVIEDKGKAVDPNEHGGASRFPELEEEPTSEPSSNLTSTASAFGTDDSIPPIAASQPAENVFEPTPPTTIISPPVETPSRRAAPPPPPSRGGSASVPAVATTAPTSDASPFEASPFEPAPSADQESSPFESSPFDTEDPAPSAFAPSVPAPPVVVAPPSDAFDVPETKTSTSSQGPKVASFDEFDFDEDEFSNVPAAQDLTNSMGQQAPPPRPLSAAPQSSAPAAPAGSEFDSWENDFSTDFDQVPSSTAPSAASATAPTASAYAVDPSFADFDSAFGETTPSTSRPAPPTSGFSFDDAFSEGPAPVAAPAQSAYAPPAGPPPGVEPAATPTTPTRPPLPSRKTDAQQDDIPDVKSIVGMGFSRSEAINALEVSDYSLQKALDHLVGGK